MMVTHEDRSRGPEGGGMTFGKALGGLALVLGAIFAAGVALGVAVVAVTDGPTGPMLATIAVTLAACGVCLWGLFRLKPWPAGDEPVAPSQRRARTMLVLSGILGGFLGIILSLGMFGDEGIDVAFSNAPLAPAAAAVILAGWLLLVPALSWIWWRNIDEHEAQAYTYGAVVALHLYYFVTPAWWIGWRGGILPEPQHMLVFLLASIAWLGGWAWRRYR